MASVTQWDFLCSAITMAHNNAKDIIILSSGVFAHLPFSISPLDFQLISDLLWNTWVHNQYVPYHLGPRTVFLSHFSQPLFRPPGLP